MTDTQILISAVRQAWSRIPAPPAEDMRVVEWECGEEGVQALVSIAPMDVDIGSAGFLGCTPLLELPPAAAAAYLGTYVWSLLDNLALQEKVGIFADVGTRAHVLHCLMHPRLWQTAIRPFLPAECRQALVELSSHLASRRNLLAISQEEVDQIRTLALAP